jgi:hypothetical protein
MTTPGITAPVCSVILAVAGVNVIFSAPNILSKSEPCSSFVIFTDKTLVSPVAIYNFTLSSDSHLVTNEIGFVFPFQSSDHIFSVNHPATFVLANLFFASYLKIAHLLSFFTITSI